MNNGGVMSTVSNIIQERAFFHSPFSFLRRNEAELAQLFLDNLMTAQKDGQIETFGHQARLFIRYLDWDSRYFSCPVYKIEFADWDLIDAPVEVLAQTLITLKNELLQRHTQYYLFSEVPSDDLVLLQALGVAGLKLIETRLTYSCDLTTFNWPKRFPVRAATEMDIPNLRQAARESRNPFDRYHADPFFSQEKADEYLATFVENCVKGFSNKMLVPANGTLPGAFMTADFMPTVSAIAGKNIARFGLAAISKERRGWYFRLMTEMLFLLKEQGVSLVYGNTQTTNYPVMRCVHKLLWEYGYTRHIFATGHKNN